MNKRIIFFALVIFMTNLLSAQTLEEQQQMLADKTAALDAKTAEVKALEGEIADLKASMVVYPEWNIGALGTIGGNFSSFNNWLGTANPNTALADKVAGRTTKEKRTADAVDKWRKKKSMDP